MKTKRQISNTTIAEVVNFIETTKDYKTELIGELYNIMDFMREQEKQLQAEQDHHHLTLSALMDVMMALKSGKDKEDMVKIFDQYVKEVEKMKEGE